VAESEKRARLRGHVVAIGKLSASERDEMFALFAQYYDCVERARFDSDLDQKDAVILLRAAGAIQGFSTLKTLPVRVGRRTHYGVYSGDTVLAREYWGQRVLGKVFLRYLFGQKLRRQLRPFWWFLISKGYKTYLLMANNFGEHWPRHEQATPPERQQILDAFGAAYFPDYYQPATGLIEFPESLGQLKFHVTPITDEQREVPLLRAAEPDLDPGHRAGLPGPDDLDHAALLLLQGHLEAQRRPARPARDQGAPGVARLNEASAHHRLVVGYRPAGGERVPAPGLVGHRHPARRRGPPRPVRR
jgi:hypothetical protein